MKPDHAAALSGAAAVLVVEDDAELRDLLVRLLTGAGHQVDAVADGQAGLHAALTRRYDAIIMDRGLPAIDGVDLTARLRRSGQQVPIIILTAYGSVADRVAGLDAGAEDYLVKPFEVDELLARVRALIRRAHASPESIIIGAGNINLTTRIA